MEVVSDLCGFGFTSVKYLRFFRLERRYGEKDKNVNVIQIEISKNYYMDENTFELKENLINVKNIFKRIVEKLNFKTSIAAE